MEASARSAAPATPPSPLELTLFAATEKNPVEHAAGVLSSAARRRRREGVVHRKNFQSRAQNSVFCIRGDRRERHASGVLHRKPSHLNRSYPSTAPRPKPAA